jgi:hypothetical protein
MVTQALIGAAVVVGLILGIWVFGKLCNRYERRLKERCPYIRRVRDNLDIDAQADLTDFDGGDE